MVCEALYHAILFMYHQKLGIRYVYQQHAKFILTFQNVHCNITFTCLTLSVMSF